MTTVQLFQRIGRRARGGDFTKLALTEQGDVIEAANTALQAVYNALPAYFKELTEGFLLPAPITTTLTVDNGSQTLSSDVFTPEQFGRSILIDGDATWNQILGTNRILNPYLGTTGEKSVVIYGDAVYSERYPFDRIIGNPRLANQSRTPLIPTLGRSNDNGAWLYQQSLGLPRVWWTQVMGNSQGNEPLLVLRFAPAPSEACAVNIRMSFWPKRLTLSDVANAEPIVVPDQFIETSLLPLALEALMSTPIWESKNDEQLIMKRAAEGLAFAAGQPGQVAAPSNRSYTPVGY